MVSITLIYDILKYFVSKKPSTLKIVLNHFCKVFTHLGHASVILGAFKLLKYQRNNHVTGEGSTKPPITSKPESISLFIESILESM